MRHRSLHRAIAIALTSLLVFAGSAAADTVAAHGDRLSPEIDGMPGAVRPGATVSMDVRFVVTCSGLQHVDPGQAVMLSWSGGGIVPLDGEIVGVTPVTLAPLDGTWAADFEGCPVPAPSHAGGVVSRVTLRAPTSVGTHVFTIVWDRALDPVGSNDPSALRGTTALDITMRVVDNTPPALDVPSDFTVEGDSTGGWTAAWSVSATDVEDATPPTPACTPAAGSILPLGDTTVSCTVADSDGATDAASFVVTVVDTTPPVLVGMPGDIAVTTPDDGGAVVEFGLPGAVDTVDASPVVACDPASGAMYPVGATTVTCTATDASGRSASGSFVVTVSYVAPPVVSAAWLEPVGEAGVLVAQRGRTVPVKVRLSVDGAVVSSGDARLLVGRCGGATDIERALGWSGNRWDVALDTSDLSSGCHRVTAVIDGSVAGSFVLEVRGESVAKTSPERRAR